jgi:simple sugar transport system substrate-binding protein
MPSCTSGIVDGDHALEHALPDLPPANVGNFNGYMEVPRMIAGCAAALNTESGGIGYLGALINPETRRLAASSYLGARYCADNYRDDISADDISFEVVWIGFWFNIPGVTLDPTEVATGFLDGGAEAIISGIDTTEAITVAGQFTDEGNASYAVPYGNVNGCAEAPASCIGAAFYNWGPAYLDVLNRVADGSWSQEWNWVEPKWDEINEDGYYTDADASVIGFKSGEGLSADVVESLNAFAAEIEAFQTDPMHEGEIFLWNSPLNLQDGTVLAEDGEAVSLLDIWFLPQLLEGMVGASE